MVALSETVGYDHLPNPRVRSGPNSPFDEADLESIAPEEAADLIAAWRPDDVDNWKMRSPRGIGRQLEKIVGGESTEMGKITRRDGGETLSTPTYIAHFLDGLAAGIEELRDIARSNPSKPSVVIRTHPWPVEPLGQRLALMPILTGVRLIELEYSFINALAKHHLPLDKIATQRAYKIIIEEARDRESPSSFSEEDDLLTSAIKPLLYTGKVETILHPYRVRAQAFWGCSTGRVSTPDRMLRT